MAYNAQRTMSDSAYALAALGVYLPGVGSAADKIKDVKTAGEVSRTASVGATRGSDADGDYVQIAAGGSNEFAHSLPWTRTGSAYSLLIVCKALEAPAAWSGIVDIERSGSALMQLARSGTSNDLTLSHTTTFGGGTFAGGVARLPNDTLRAMLLVCNGGTIKLFTNGAAPIVASGTSGADAGTATFIRYGKSRNNDSAWPMKYYAAVPFNQAWTDAEAQSLVDDPQAALFASNAAITSIAWDPTDAADAPTAIEVEIGTPETVRIEDQAGNPVADVAVVSADTAVYTVAPATTGADGLVTITALAPGVANLTGSRAGVSNAVAAVTVPTTGSGGGEIPTAMPPTITTTSPLPAVTAGTASSVSIAISGDGPFTLDVAAGALPAGLALPAGMPLPSPIALPWTGSAGGGTSASFTLRATGPDGAQDSKAFVLDIQEAAPAGTAPQFTTAASLPAGTAGVDYGHQLVGSGSGALTYSLGSNPPAGWTVSSAGMLTSSAPVAGSYSIPVVLTGDTAPPATRTFTVTIAAAVATVTGVTFAPPSPQSILRGGTLQVSTAVLGTNNPAQGGTWAKVGGPTSATHANGVLSVDLGMTPGQATYRFTPLADTEQTFDYVINVLALAPSITTAPVLPAGVAGVAGSRQLSADGDAPITWALNQGAPAGWSITPSGLLNYPDTVTAQTYQIPVTATNAGGTDSETFSLAVTNPGPVVKDDGTGSIQIEGIRAAAAGAAGVRGTVWASAGNGRVGAKLFDFGYSGATVPTTKSFDSQARMTIAVPAGVQFVSGQAVMVYLESPSTSPPANTPIFAATIG